jgi:RNA recognition motif-containing protein
VAVSVGGIDGPRRLFVGNLDHSVMEDTIIKVFSRFGVVSSCAFLFNFDGPRRGKPKGFCFVEMATHGDALAAIAALNGRLLRGRELRVNIAKEERTEGLRSTATAELKAPTVDEFALAHQAQMVKITLQRMGVAPAVDLTNISAASPVAPVAATDSDVTGS